EVMGEFTGRKIRTAPRRYGFSTYVEITDEDEVRRLGHSILERIGFSGVAKVDFKREPRTKRLYLLEINPRFNLWHHAGAAAGVSGREARVRGRHRRLWPRSGGLHRPAAGARGALRHGQPRGDGARSARLLALRLRRHRGGDMDAPPARCGRARLSRGATGLP